MRIKGRLLGSWSAAASACAVWYTMVRACSVAKAILLSWRCIRGMSSRRLPKALRCLAMYSASVSARRINPAARTPFDRRELLIMSAMCLKP